jgi:hypothetical protein
VQVSGLADASGAHHLVLLVFDRDAEIMSGVA